MHPHFWNRIKSLREKSRTLCESVNRNCEKNSVWVEKVEIISRLMFKPWKGLCGSFATLKSQIRWHSKWTFWKQARVGKTRKKLKSENIKTGLIVSS